MIELQVVSLIVGVVSGAAVASLYHKLPKKRKPRRTKAEIIAAKIEKAVKI